MNPTRPAGPVSARPHRPASAPRPESLILIESTRRGQDVSSADRGRDARRGRTADLGSLGATRLASRSRRSDNPESRRPPWSRKLIGRIMDPYQTLGLAPGCTRDQVKEAFRAKVWRAHPDRGGAEQPFIELCAAYKQLL